MTLNEAEDIQRACRAAATAFHYDTTGYKGLCGRAAEALEWLLEQLNDVEGQIEYLEQFEP